MSLSAAHYPRAYTSVPRMLFATAARETTSAAASDQDVFAVAIDIASSLLTKVQIQFEDLFQENFGAVRPLMNQARVIRQAIDRAITNAPQNNGQIQFDKTIQKFFETNNIEVSGLFENGQWNIDDTWQPPSETGTPITVSADQAAEAKNSVEMFGARLTDQSARTGINLQSSVQSFNQLFILINQMQIMRNELNKTILQGMR